MFVILHDLRPLKGYMVSHQSDVVMRLDTPGCCRQFSARRALITDVVRGTLPVEFSVFMKLGIYLVLQCTDLGSRTNLRV